MQKLTMQEMQESFVKLELSKVELLMLIAMYSTGCASCIEDDQVEDDRLEAIETALVTGLESVDSSSFPDKKEDNIEGFIKLYEKLSLIFANALTTKH